MGHGMNSFGDKQKRAIRRRNHVARDLRDRKYHQRRVERRVKDKYPLTWEEEDAD